MARRRVVGNEPKGDVGEYSTISRKNIICKNSREIKDFTKKMSTGTGVSLWPQLCCMERCPSCSGWRRGGPPSPGSQKLKYSRRQLPLWPEIVNILD